MQVDMQNENNILIKAVMYSVYFSIATTIIIMFFYLCAKFTGNDEADAFLKLASSPNGFNGIMVGGIGFGLAFFLIKEHENIKQLILSIFNIDDHSRQYLNALDKFRIRPKTIVISLSIWVAGFYILTFSELIDVSLDSWLYEILLIASSSIYVVASFIFIYMWSINYLVLIIDSKALSINLLEPISPLKLESLFQYFDVIAIYGVSASLIGIRGTLTGITITSLTPIPTIFLITALIFSFLPKYVFRKITKLYILKNIEYVKELITKARNSKEDLFIVEKEKALLEIKEKYITEILDLSSVSFKNSLSMFMFIIIILQFLMAYDKPIQELIQFMFKFKN